MGFAFRTAADIANRALDHIGAPALNATLGLSENSDRAIILSRVYPQLRQAELRRNVWRFAIRHAVLRPLDNNTMLLVGAQWMAGTTYFVGSIVADPTGQLWSSTVPNNIGNQPGTAAGGWQQYFGPMSVMLYDATTTYKAGELVYTTAGDGTVKVYQSLQSDNADNPATATAWDATTTYFKNQVVTFSATAYMSRIDFNINQTPTNSPADWSNGTTYAINDLVTGSDGVEYKSLTGSNLAHDPTIDGGVHWLNLGLLTPWTSIFVGGTGSVKWLQIGGAEFPAGVTLQPFNILYPIGSGPLTQDTTRNVFRLPASFLRMAPQDPKAGSFSPLGAPSNLVYNDWLFEGDYIVSPASTQILFRFTADMVDVTAMDPTFCEGLGARIGMEVCETLTQSNARVKICADFYQEMMTDARLVNGIETGAEEPPLDDWIACRS